MAEYEVTMTHRFLIETDDIREVQNEYEFPDLQVPSVKWAEFLDASFTYEDTGAK